MTISKRKISITLGALILAAAFLAPFLIRAKSMVYVDDDATGTMDGSYSHPYKKIQDAIDKAKKKDRDVKIKKGTYRENIVIHSDVKVSGTDKDDVIISAKDDDEPTVKMKDDTKISDVTIRDGEVGILVKEGDSAKISSCNIIHNDEDGIRAEKASVKEKYQLEIYDSYIADNDWNGIYAEKRKSIISGNEIYFNGKDGVEVEDGSRASIRKNRFKENDGDGLRVTIDDSNIWVEKNTFYNNDKSGLEVRASYGREGYVGVKQNKFYKNDHWGLVRIERTPFSNASWDRSLQIFGDNIFYKNKEGAISHIINVY